MGLHNRLTHSLKVEQVGYSIVGRLKKVQPDEAKHIDVWAVQAACLAHDLGHPPFGHAGEMELDALVVCPAHRAAPRSIALRRADPCKNCILEDGFEGNAQSFRIITLLAGTTDASRAGLNLTRATLLAASKYPWTRDAAAPKVKKWGAYDCDAEVMSWAKQGSASTELALEAEIMDWADDIAYAVHDVEDFFRAGLVPLDDYKRQKGRLDEFFSYCSQHFGSITPRLRRAVEGALALGPTSAYAGTTADLHALQQLRATLLSQFISNAQIVDGRLVINGLVREVNSILKQMIWYHIIDDPTLFHIQHGQRRVLRETFDHVRAVVTEAYDAGDGIEMDPRMLRRLPPVLRHTLQLSMVAESTSPYKMEQRLMRATLDYISSLSDAEIYQVHSVMNGRESYGRIG